MHWRRTLSVIGAHAEGEVGNVITGGIVDVPGASMFEKKEYLERQADEIRRMILFEPRGGPCHAVNVLLPPTRPEADIGFVIMEATKYPAMSGSNAICVATVVLESGIVPMVEPETRLVMEAPAGLIEARCRCRDGKVEAVRLTHVPAFIWGGQRILDVPGLGMVHIDIAYGGIFYAIVDAGSLGFAVSADEAHDIAQAGLAIRTACNAQFEVVHPTEGRIRGIANVLFAGPIERRDGQLHARNAVSAAMGASIARRVERAPRPVLRSSTPTASSARVRRSSTNPRSAPVSSPKSWRSRPSAPNRLLFRPPPGRPGSRGSCSTDWIPPTPCPKATPRRMSGSRAKTKEQEISYATSHGRCAMGHKSPSELPSLAADQGV